MYRLIFKLYFAVHDFVEPRFFYYACKLLRAPHPKNLYAYRTRVFLDHLAPGDRVADLGCGTGKLVEAMRARTACALGVDLKPPLLLGNAGADAFMRGDILDPDLVPRLLERKIDTITLSHVLEHLESPVAFLERLKPFRKVLICVPSEENWRFQFKRSLGLDARTDPTHFREYSVGLLRSEAESAGFRVTTTLYNSEGEIFAVCESF